MTPLTETCSFSLFRPLFLTGLVSMLGLTLSSQAAGTWVQLANYAPGPSGLLLLLADGTVISEDLSIDYGPGWFRLTPDAHGSYVNGTWSTIAPMHDTRLDFSSVVLTDGRVLVAGAEYGSGGATSEVYNPVSNIWTAVAVPTSLLNPAKASPEAGENQGFYDSIAKILTTGKVLVAPVGGNALGSTLLFTPGPDTWSAGPTTIKKAYPDQDEASWVKLPDNSILTVDGGAVTSERYIPASNTWIKDANAPVHLYDSYGEEVGPALLLPNGKAIFFGSTGHTTIYTPSGNTNPGTWVGGPDFPDGQGMPDAPAAMMVNGKILCAVSEAPFDTNNIFTSPTSFYEYDYLSNSFTEVDVPGGGVTFQDATYPTLLLDLPDGSVLFTYQSTDLYIYKPDGLPLAAGQPVIQSITTNSDGSIHLTGKMFNGLSEGAAYGDDEQMDSNYPLVRFVDAVGTVRYGRSYNWSSTRVMTGNAVVSTECALPAGASYQDVIQVIANGIASFASAGIVSNAYDGGPGSLRQIIALLPANSTITFVTNLSGSTILLTNGELTPANNLTIDASMLPGGIQINGNNNSRIFEVSSGVTLTLNSLTLINGYAGIGNWGGAIENSGSLNLNHCTISNNSADSDVSGGAIANYNLLTMTACTLTGNTAGFGGGVENIYVCTLENCTFSGNTAEYNGGAAENNSGTLGLIQCTLSGNTANSGGAVDNYLGIFSMTNSILAGNSAPEENGADFYNWSQSTATIGGTNIVQSLVNDGTNAGSGSVIADDPMLNSLGNYGGVTPTMAPLPGSPAIDAGSDDAAIGIATDQRGYPRFSGSHVDIGAVEVQIASVPPVLQSQTLTGSSPPGNGTFQFSFTNLIGGSFTAFASTNVGSPLNLWSNIGTAIENPIGSGQFQFTDSATNQPRRFYRVRSP